MINPLMRSSKVYLLVGLKKNADKIKESIENNLDSSQIFLIESSLDLMGHASTKTLTNQDLTPSLPQINYTKR